MPLYEYRCDACGQRFEVIQKFSDPAPDACRLCGKGPVHRQASSPAIQFKGSGFYITDYARKGGGGESGSQAGTKGSDAKAAEGKSDAGSSSGSTPAKSDAPAAASTPSTATSKE